MGGLCSIFVGLTGYCGQYDAVFGEVSNALEEENVFLCSGTPCRESAVDLPYVF